MPRARKMKKKDKKMKISSFLKISWFGVRICNFESKFSFFFICNFMFFSCSFVFDGFPLFFIDFHGFPGFQVPRARKMKKKMKKMKISSFLKISWFGVRICNFESKFSFFFICNFIFFSFSFVFDGFPLFFIVFHGFPGFQVPQARKMKKNEKKHEKMIKK